tara:strand:- start:4461 stop:5774 length:1314 start_codon:yes stop_codon:yes gene_type:complete
MALASPTQGSTFERFTIFSLDGSKEIELKAGVVEFQYFEDLFSPTFTANLSITNTADPSSGQRGVYDDLPIRGGEKVEIHLTTPIELDRGTSVGEFVIDMYVNNISNYVGEKQLEVFTLNLVSRHAIINNNTRIIEKFVGKSISDLINVLLKACKFTGDDIDEVENTKGKINFIGNMRKPFTIAPMLAARAIPENSKQNTAGFFFWQTRNGMRFKSIESLISGDVVAEYIFNRGVQTGENSELNFKKILGYTVESHANILRSAASGEYSTYRIYFNPHTWGFTQYDTSYAAKWGTMGGEHLGTELDEPPPEADPTNGEHPFSRPYMAHRILTGINATGCLEPKVDTTVVQPQTEDMAQSIWRYSSLFNQSMTLTVPVNIKLMAGDKIDCQFPKVTSDDEVDDKLSGLYIIKELSHYFAGNRSYTSLRVLRDTSGSKQ